MPDEEQKMNYKDIADSRREEYEISSRYICGQSPCYTNRLIIENSPYLLQHAHNPIDWLPWAAESLEKARREDKPIFLSIGYAACHWCHVMEEESFDNKDIASLLNEHFISIKVDREQRPDIDEFYANAVMYFQGVQGWPMSLFLTPDGKAFFGGGYYNEKEFRSLLLQIKEKWETRREHTISEAERVLEHLQAKKGETIQISHLQDAVRKQALNDILSFHDSYYGGFGHGSKFPREPWLFILLNEAYLNRESDYAFTALKNTLTHIARGGIHDHLAGGFHRYAVDPYWNVPHFEKMLYTQSLLARLFLQSHNIEPDNELKSVANKTLQFMLNKMQSPGGGFYASLDADTPEGEGYYYLWNTAQLKSVLDTDEAVFAAELYNIDDFGESKSKGNVLHMTSSVEVFSRTMKLPVETTQKKIASINKKLLTSREKRTAPSLDKKIIMSWNGIAIMALTEGARVLGNPDYLNTAVKTAEFIWDNMQHDKGFYRVHIQGKGEQTAQLDDYVWYLAALIALYDAEDNILWLDRAEKIADRISSGFLDNRHGGLFQTDKDDNNGLPVRPKSAFDKTLPSANAIASQSLIRLARRTGNHDYTELAENILSAFAAEAKHVPSAYSGLLIASHELSNETNTLPLFAARGNIRIDARISPLSNKLYQLEIELKMREKWHINSSKPLDKELIPTRIQMAGTSDWSLKSVSYPASKMMQTSFSKRPLTLYEDTTVITAEIRKGKSHKNPTLILDIQACNDRVCLPPEQFYILPLPGHSPTGQ
ncbi:MAG TPA: thioredoxin domain-containing protein [Gammaproteobacteria bacterium]